jgi:hypothetical protein
MWNRDKDTFHPGRWFNGKIYPERSDLSPEGRRMIYFAMAGVAWAVPETGGTWTAISLLPALNAVALWAQGDTRSGGGMFTSNASYWIDLDANTRLIRDESGLRREAYRPFRSRLERDGWTVRGTDLTTPILEKPLAKGWLLRRLGWHGRYELAKPGECLLRCPSWTWAEWDRDRLVWAEAGALRTASLKSRELGPASTLADFNEAAPHSGL